MHPVLVEIKAKGPKVASKSPLWQFMTKEPPKLESDNEEKLPN